MELWPFVILITVHILVLLYCAQYMRGIKDQAIEDGMPEAQANEHAKQEYKKGLYKPGHPMFKIGIYNILFIAVLIFMIFKFTPLMSLF